MDNDGKPLLAGDPRTLGSFEARARLGETAAGVVFLGEWAGDVPAVMAVLRPAAAADAAALDRFEAAVDAMAEDRVVLGAMPRGLVVWAVVPVEDRDEAIALLRAAQMEAAAEVQAAKTAEVSPKPTADDDPPWWDVVIGLIIMISWSAMVTYLIVQWSS
ncbi:hypothetical protein [Actinomadura rubrisoli]|uniref:Uncharacterized protein n=1 Tax=Actinomadura rubrisoli TaxID=2530368 RepID=A0A4R5ATJ1_9ACTN|nr:hypothetical protein [Actinomadura rubrisoli]TDD73822.1 hypothetical protein E1298_33260 [Actinomadura rubrisoli]